MTSTPTSTLRTTDVVLKVDLLLAGEQLLDLCGRSTPRLKAAPYGLWGRKCGSASAGSNSSVLSSSGSVSVHARLSTTCGGTAGHIPFCSPLSSGTGEQIGRWSASRLVSHCPPTHLLGCLSRDGQPHARAYVNHLPLFFKMSGLTFLRSSLCHPRLLPTDFHDYR